MIASGWLHFCRIPKYWLVGLLLLVVTGCSSISAVMDERRATAEEYAIQAAERFRNQDWRATIALYQEFIVAEQRTLEPRPIYLSEAAYNIGACYFKLGEYDRALPALEQALAFERPLNRPDAMVYRLDLIGSVYQVWGQYETALQGFDQAIMLARQANHQQALATALIFKGLLYQEWSRYEEAIATYEDALKLVGAVQADASWEALSATGKFAVRVGEGYLHSNIGAVYLAWGKYDRALAANERAIAEFRRAGEEWGVGLGNQQIGSVYLAWGRYNDARRYFEQAIWSFRKANDQLYVSSAFHSLGEAYRRMGQFENAFGALQQALNVARQAGKDDDIALSLNKIGELYRAQEQYDQALTTFEQALELNRKTGREAAIATDLHSIAEIDRLRGEDDQAIALFEDALQRNRALQRQPDIANNLTGVGGIYHAQERYADAIPLLEEAVGIKEQLRQTASGDIRRDYFASQITTYQLLISCYINLKDFPNAFRIMELSRAKLLEERLTGTEAVAIATLDNIQTHLAEDTAIIIYANTTDQKLARLLITNATVMGQENEVGHIQHSSPTIGTSERITSDSANRGTNQPDQRGLGLQQERSEIPMIGANTTLTYTDLDTLIREYRTTLLSLMKEQEHALTALSNDVYRVLLSDFRSHLHGINRLIILPDGLLNFLPFETLRDDEGRYLIETYQIAYAQSLGVLDALRQRQYAAERKPLLAFGGAVYEAAYYAEDMRDAEVNIASLRAQVDDALRRGTSLRSVYQRLGRDTWDNLPGTLTEVRAIASVTPGAEIVTGADVNETAVKELAANAALQKYRILHFATHGDANPEIPELSALVLSQTENAAEDGYLCAGEIARLNIAADFVNLSACETGLGKLYTGEGVIGLTQAFLLAGANGLSVSLWSVADESTAQFMTALYKIAGAQGLNYADAISAVKRRFIQGDFGEYWTHPYYWAPFVYYGK